MQKLLGIVAGVISSLAASAADATTQIISTGYVAPGAGYPDSTGVELIDGFIADRHFNSYNEPTVGDPYVGFRGFSPTMTFAFGTQQTFGSLVVWVDDFSGIAGVTAPASISAVVNGITYSSFTVGTPLDAGFTYPLFNYPAGGGTPYRLSLTGAVGNTVDLAVIARGEWTFLSEVQFFAPTNSAVPEPATWAMMILGFGMVGRVMRRRGAARVTYA